MDNASNNNTIEEDTDQSMLKINPTRQKQLLEAVSIVTGRITQAQQAANKARNVCQQSQTTCRLS